MSQKKKHRRKTEFIDAEVQGALARRLAMHWLLYTGLTTVLVLGLKWMSNPFTPFTDHAIEAWWTYGPVLLVLVCLAPIFVFDAVKLSNRFTGPVLRLRNATKQLASGGCPEKITLRQGDFWKDLAEDFNQVIERVEDSQPKPHGEERA